MSDRNIYVNADDYGADLFRSIGIYLAAKSRAINSTSALVLRQTPLEQRLLRHVRKRNGLRVGIHVDLTSPQLLTTKTSELLQNKTKFHDKRDVWIGLLSEKINYDSVRKEITAQISRFRRICGSNPDFMDAHNHVHIANPTIYNLFNDISKTEGISFTRIPLDRMTHLADSSLGQELSAFVSRSSASYGENDSPSFLCKLAENMRGCRLSDIALYELCVKRLRKQDKDVQDKAEKHHFYGTVFGHSSSVSGLLRIFQEIFSASDQPISHEIMLHPGLNLWTDRNNPFSCAQRLSELAQAVIVSKLVLPSPFTRKYLAPSFRKTYPRKGREHNKTNQINEPT
ncbi:MAG: ChbG/HpnK family deacetylase [Proteobacteria bacterium]|nr:ChbG/HpnK family deacetylase [Pseudomonadota bacterium]